MRGDKIEFSIYSMLVLEALLIITAADSKFCDIFLDFQGNSDFDLRVSLERRETGLSPPVKYFYQPFQGGTSFVDHLCHFCLVFVMLLCVSVY